MSAHPLAIAPGETPAALDRCTVPAGCLRAGDEIVISTEDGRQAVAFVRAVESRKSGHDVRLQSGTRAATVRYEDAERVDRLAEAVWAA